MPMKKKKAKPRLVETRICIVCRMKYEWHRDDFDDLGCCCDKCRAKMLRERD